jgi:hypothetical protein
LFDLNFDIDDLEWIGLDLDSLVGAGVAPGMTHAITSRVACASAITTTAVVDVPEEFEESEDSKLEDDFSSCRGSLF